ncbi:RNA polymerase sigma-70 factor, ECF subfamily [Caminicella sporogenes DSM 14501]|uniref:RNA polymerase sigma-70 factor, ECF subfamily n=1 Tax=Caminicella sporogenes DSM 14501 TaxID=1121266 RepID=A0A1M6LYY7_9FIRM|nr:RNA polymerase sigma factor [Caminicella sporogenes]RKD28000.1 RNA polymerase subunit sigma-24 [Caminicella sporogenes]SHJ76401.1 RNA polymerase sigma-70 factor, ECF subfamily [Caminicella sporogenes DSM 14501]
MCSNEKKLIEKSKKGDVESFEKLIEKYQVIAFNIAYRLIGNVEDAKDVTQEALIKVYKFLKNFKGESSFSTWLYKIVMNTCLDMIRKNNKIHTISLDKPIENKNGNYNFELSDNKNVLDEKIEQDEKIKIIQRAIKKLPEKYRVVLVLRDLQDFSYSDISDIINCPVGTVKSRINRGRMQLKEILKEEMELFLEN